MTEKACKNCRRIVRSNVCPACKSSDLTSNWRGVLVVINSDSLIAKEAGFTAPGKYAIRTK